MLHPDFSRQHLLDNPELPSGSHLQDASFVLELVDESENVMLNGLLDDISIYCGNFLQFPVIFPNVDLVVRVFLNPDMHYKSCVLFKSGMMGHKRQLPVWGLNFLFIDPEGNHLSSRIGFCP